MTVHDEARKVLTMARAEVSRIVDEIFNQRKPGWRMGIPARPRYDSDIIFTDALNALAALAKGDKR